MNSRVSSQGELLGTLSSERRRLSQSVAHRLAPSYGCASDVRCDAACLQLQQQVVMGCMAASRERQERAALCARAGMQLESAPRRDGDERKSSWASPIESKPSEGTSLAPRGASCRRGQNFEMKPAQYRTAPR